MPVWNDRLNERLRHLRLVETRSFKMILQEPDFAGFTESALSTQCKRLRIVVRTVVAKAAKKAVARAAAPKPARLADPVQEVPASAKLLVDLAPRECTWPVARVDGLGGWAFCAAPAKPGFPWCETHAKRGFRPAKEAGE